MWYLLLIVTVLHMHSNLVRGCMFAEAGLKRYYIYDFLVAAKTFWQNFHCVWIDSYSIFSTAQSIMWLDIDCVVRIWIPTGMLGIFFLCCPECLWKPFSIFSLSTDSAFPWNKGCGSMKLSICLSYTGRCWEYRALDLSVTSVPTWYSP